MDADGAVLLELERLRGTVGEGFATVNGRLDGMTQRDADTVQYVEKLDRRVSALERKVWMAAGLVGVLAIGCSGLLTSMLIR